MGDSKHNFSIFLIKLMTTKSIMVCVSIIKLFTNIIAPPFDHSTLSIVIPSHKSLFKAIVLRYSINRCTCINMCTPCTYMCTEPNHIVKVIKDTKKRKCSQLDLWCEEGLTFQEEQEMNLKHKPRKSKGNF